MTKEIESGMPRVHMAPEMEKILAHALRGGEGRAAVVLPSGAGKCTWMTAFLQGQSDRCFVIAASGEAAARLRAAWRKDPATKEMHLSADPLSPGQVTVTDAQVVTNMGAVSTLRLFLEVWRKASVGAILLDEPYDFEAGCCAVLARLLEVLPHARVVAVHSRMPADRSEADRRGVEALCGRSLAAWGTEAAVEAGALRAHRDLLYLCDPAPVAQPLRRMAERRAAVVHRALSLPVMAQIGPRLLREGADYLYPRREAVLAIAALISTMGYGGTGQLFHLLGGKRHKPTAREAEVAFSFLLRSRTLLSDDEKNALREALAHEGIFSEGRFVDHRAIWACATAADVKTDALLTIMESEEAVLGTDLRLLIPATAEGALHWRDTLLARGGSPVACAGEESVILPAKLAGAFAGLCRHAVEERPYGERRAYTECRPHCAEEMTAALACLFARGDIRVLLLPAHACREEIATRSNVLLLTDVTESCADGVRYAPAAAALRACALAVDGAERGWSCDRSLHIWHIALAAGETHPLVADEVHEAEAVRARLRCFPAAHRLSVEPIPAGHAEREARNAAACTAAAHRYGMMAAFERDATEDICMTVSIPATSALPAASLGDVGRLALAALLATVGGFFLPHLFALAVQARGMGAVVAVFLALTALAAGMLAGGLAHIIRTLPYLWRHRKARRSLGRLINALLRALRASGRVQGGVSVALEGASRRRDDAGAARFLLRIRGEQMSEVDVVARSVAEMLSPVDHPRYILCRTDKKTERALRPGGRADGRGQAILLACPSALAVRDADAEIFAACLSPVLGGAELLYTRRGAGPLVLGAAQSRGHINRAGASCEIYAER